MDFVCFVLGTFRNQSGGGEEGKGREEDDSLPQTQFQANGRRA